MNLSQRVAAQIRMDAEDFHHGPRMTVNECELAAEVQRLDAANAGQRVALEVLRSDEGLAKDLQAVRDACADRIDEALLRNRNATDEALRDALRALAQAMRERRQ